MIKLLPCFDSNAQLYDPHPTNCIDVRVIGTIALKCWNHLFSTKFPAFFQDDVQAVVAEAKYVSLEPDVFPRGVVNENLEHDFRNFEHYHEMNVLLSCYYVFKRKLF